MGTGSGTGVGSEAGGGGVRRGLCIICRNPTCKFSQFYFHEIRTTSSRLKFQAWSGEVAQTGTMTFQVETLDLIQPTLILKLGAIIPNTNYKLTSFVLKKNTGADGVSEGVSELTVTHITDATALALPLNQIVHASEIAAVFNYNAIPRQPSKSFSVFRIGKFSLPDVPGKKYKLKEIRGSEAVVLTPSGEIITFRKGA